MSFVAQETVKSRSLNTPEDTFQALKIDRIEKTYGGVKILRGVTIEVARRQITGIIGPNGAGKSTLLDIISGFAAPDAGRVWLAGTDVTGKPVRQRSHAGLARTFQIPRELGELTVLENLLLAATQPRHETVAHALVMPWFLKRSDRRATGRALDLLTRINLAALANAQAKTLSGGQKKLLELARALMSSPKVLLLDEPVAGVAPPLRAVISELIASLKDQDITTLIVEHDMDFVARLCDRVFVMAEGANLVDGSFEDVARDTRVIEAYVGAVV